MQSMEIIFPRILISILDIVLILKRVIRQTRYDSTNRGGLQK